MQKKIYINIFITKQYKGLSVVKYVFCLIKTWSRILWFSSVSHVVCLQNYQPLPSTKYLLIICEKYPQNTMGFEALD